MRISDFHQLKVEVAALRQFGTVMMAPGGRKQQQAGFFRRIGIPTDNFL